MNEKERLKYHMTKLFEFMDYFDDYPYNFLGDERTAFAEAFGEILIDKNIIKDLDSGSNRLKNELNDLEIRIHKLARSAGGLKDLYFGIKSRNEKPRQNKVKLKNDREHYNVSQAAVELEISRPTMTKIFKEKPLGLVTEKVGSRDVIYKQDLIRFIKSYKS